MRKWKRRRRRKEEDDVLLLHIQSATDVISRWGKRETREKMRERDRVTERH